MTPSELKLFTRFPTCTQCDPDYPDILELQTALRRERGRSVMMKMGNRIRIGSKAIGPMEAVITDENPETGNTIWKALPILLLVTVRELRKLT
jgi:hypothetical protein